MENEEQLTQMFLMQKTLNQNILKEFGQEAMTEEKLQMAIIDELGELTHELKGDWCWWKKTQKPVDRKRVLEELVDVYHFVMTWELEQRNIVENISHYKFDLHYKYYMNADNISQCIYRIASYMDKLGCLIDLTKMLDFTFDEVYQEYLNKNKINYERLKNGY